MIFIWVYIFTVFAWGGAVGKTMIVRYRGCMIPVGVAEDQVPDGKHRGSFTEQVVQPLQSWPFIRWSMTVQSCVGECFSRRYDLAALQNGNRCYCGTNIRGLAYQDKDFCYMRCPGNCRQRCGGPAAMSVYVTGYQHEPDVMFPSSILQRGYIGCLDGAFGKDLCSPYLPKPDLTSRRMTPQLCALYCYAGGSQVPIAATVRPDTCCCSYARKWAQRTSKARPQDCNRPCDGDQTAGSCWGYNQGANRTYFNVWDVEDMAAAGLPNEGESMFRAGNGWIEATFNETFEEYDTLLTYRKELEQQKLYKEFELANGKK